MATQQYPMIPKFRCKLDKEAYEEKMDHVKDLSIEELLERTGGCLKNTIFWDDRHIPAVNEIYRRYIRLEKLAKFVDDKNGINQQGDLIWVLDLILKAKNLVKFLDNLSEQDHPNIAECWSNWKTIAKDVAKRVHELIEEKTDGKRLNEADEN